MALQKRAEAHEDARCAEPALESEVLVESSPQTDQGRTYPHPAGTGIHDHGHLLQMFEDVEATGRIFMVHPHDQALMDHVEQGYWKKGDRSPEAYAKTLATHDGIIWDTATATLLRMAKATGCRLHIVHVQTTEGIAMIRRAKEEGLPITAEVNHWALFLGSWDDVLELGPYCLSYWVPDHHKAAVWDAINDGTIDIVSSDHAPHTRAPRGSSIRCRCCSTRPTGGS